MLYDFNFLGTSGEMALRPIKGTCELNQFFAAAVVSWSCWIVKSLRIRKTEEYITATKVTKLGDRWGYLRNCQNRVSLTLGSTVSGLEDLTTVFVDTRLWKTKHPRKRFPNFRQSYVLSTDLIEIHQSQPLVWPSDILYVMLAVCDWWISIRYVDNT